MYSCSVGNDQCVNRDTWQQFHGGHVPSRRKPSQQNRPQISLPITLQLYFPHVCPLQVQVLGTSSVSPMGKLKWFLWNTSRGRHCAGWAHPVHCPTKAKETLTPNLGFSDIQLHYTSRNNNKGTSAGLLGPAGEPVMLRVLPALAQTSKSSSFQPQHNKAILCNTGTNLCENCQTDDSISNF